MSTMIALLLVLSSLVGCAGETLTNVKNALPDLPPETFSFSVELEEYEETVRDEDGAALVECCDTTIEHMTPHSSTVTPEWRTATPHLSTVKSQYSM